MDGLAAERARRSARGVRGAGSKRQVAAAGRARGAGCRCGRRPAGGARGAARRGARGARAAGAVWGQLGGLEAARGARPRVARPSPRPLRPRPCHLLRSQGNGPGVVAVGTEREATQGRAAAPRRVAGAWLWGGAQWQQAFATSAPPDSPGTQTWTPRLQLLLHKVRLNSEDTEGKRKVMSFSGTGQSARTPRTPRQDTVPIAARTSHATWLSAEKPWLFTPRCARVSPRGRMPPWREGGADWEAFRTSFHERMEGVRSRAPPKLCQELTLAVLWPFITWVLCPFMKPRTGLFGKIKRNE